MTDRPSAPTPAGRRRAGSGLRAPSGGARVAAVAALALALVVVYLVTDLPSAWEYALGLRMRTVAGMIVAAAAIGAATVLFQTVTANRVLTPGVMGFDAVFLLVQVAVAATVGPVVLVAAPPLVSWVVELAVMTAVVLALYRWLFIGRRLDLHVLVLAGLVLGVMLRSVTAFVQRLLDPDTFAVVQDLLFASFTAVDRELILPTAVLVAAALASLLPVRRSLDVLALGPAVATSLGVEHRRTVMHVVVVVSVLVAASTALVGPVVFLGLIVANLAYTLVGHRHDRSIPVAVGAGVITLVGGQLVLDRLLGFATELPVVIEFAGGVLFIVLVLTGRAR